jgi:predicted dehydrogenase
MGVNLNRPLRVGIIGVGGAGLAHVKYFRNIPGCHLVAFFDISEAGCERAMRVARGELVTDDLEQFWKAGLDWVSICSPDSTHAYYIVEALKKGIHVLCEKPITDSVEGCNQILAAVRDNPQIVIGVQHQMRFVPLFQEVRNLLRAGKLGSVSFVEGYYVHDLRERASLYDRWRFVEGATPLIYSGCHIIDLFRYLLQDEVETVYAMANHLSFQEYPESDLNSVLLRFKKGTIGHVLVSFGASRPQDHSLRVLGSEGCIDNNIFFGRNGFRAIMSPPSLFGEILPSASLRARTRGMIKNLLPWVSGILYRYGPRLTGPGHYSLAYFPFRTYEHQTACHACITDFIEAVRRGGNPIVSVTEAIETVLVAIAGVLSFREDRVVRVQEIRDQLQA